jgi:hypothetical protein
LLSVLLDPEAGGVCPSETSADFHKTTWSHMQIFILLSHTLGALQGSSKVHAKFY